jgi:hypothetical protein
VAGPHNEKKPNHLGTPTKSPIRACGFVLGGDMCSAVYLITIILPAFGSWSEIGERNAGVDQEDCLG